MLRKKRGLPVVLQKRYDGKPYRSVIRIFVICLNVESAKKVIKDEEAKLGSFFKMACERTDGLAWSKENKIVASIAYFAEEVFSSQIVQQRSKLFNARKLEPGFYCQGVEFL